ncbi:MAG: hypothetical protein LBN29_11250 [Mediterranea sp.]|jgi:hypothetical protein|nr:hypothetical protein [Mediterranea sp.]
MNKVTYLERKTRARYDDARVMAYLGEEIVETVMVDEDDGTESVLIGYAYTGPEADGGTLIDAPADDRNTLINGIIRSRYPQTLEDSVKTHQLLVILDPGHPKAKEYAREWEEFDRFRLAAIDTVDGWLEGGDGV